MTETVLVHIAELKPGDTVIHNGEIKTVCKSDLKYDTFMGHTLFGDSYQLGDIKVQKVVYQRFYKGKKIE